jgi:ABC-type uncharacterized transport system substrate-binding protein
MSLRDTFRIQEMKKSIVFILTLLTAGTISAHPHIFINNTTEFICDENGITGIKNVWEFDEIFSKTIIEEYDLDGSGNFSSKEIDDIYENAFINIKNFNFYTNVKFKGNTVSHSKVSSFKPYLKGEILVYEFFVPLDIKLSDSDYIDVCIYDDSYFIAFADPTGNVKITKSTTRAYRYSIKKNSEVSDWGPAFPSIIRVSPGQ